MRKRRGTAISEPELLSKGRRQCTFSQWEDAQESHHVCGLEVTEKSQVHSHENISIDSFVISIITFLLSWVAFAYFNTSFSGFH